MLNFDSFVQFNEAGAGVLNPPPPLFLKSLKPLGSPDLYFRVSKQIDKIQRMP